MESAEHTELKTRQTQNSRYLHISQSINKVKDAGTEVPLYLYVKGTHNF